LLTVLALAPVAPAARAADEAAFVARPKFQVAMGMGASLDRNAPNRSPGRPITAFFFAGGLGDGGVGLELRAFANGANFSQVTRLALELAFVLRPLEPMFRDHDDYGARILRAASLDIGPSVERVSLGPAATRRFGLMVGAHFDMPVGPAGAGKEMRVRLGVRRLRAGSAVLGDIEVADSTLELYAQLAFVF
jgi:hypothetical protein